MARINVKLDSVESGFAVYPEEKYLVRILDSSKIKTAQSGEPKIVFISRILEGEFEGKLYSWDCSLQPQAWWNLKALLEALGVEWDEDGFELEDCFDLEVGVDVVIQTWKDEPRNYVASYFKA